MECIGLRTKTGKIQADEKLEIVHDGKSSFRFNCLIEYIENKRGKPDLNMIPEKEEKLHDAMNSAKEFYKKLLPPKQYTCPSSIEETVAYQHADIDRVLEMAAECGIDSKHEPYLLWIARMFLCIPLPPFWRKRTIGDSVVYYNAEYDVLSTIHPASDYVLSYIDNVRDLFASKKANILSIS